MPEPAVTEERLRLAEQFLQEAVYRSRAKQAASGAMPLGDPALGTCGLGEKAAVALDLSDRGRELFAELWPAGLPPTELEPTQTLLADWVRRQDALDRKRNHFMKDFRHEHGFDAARYTPDQRATWRTGLDAVNAEVDEARLTAARALLQGR